MKQFAMIPIAFASILFLLGSCEKEIRNKVPAVNAGADTTIQLPLDSFYLTGSVNDPDDKVITFLWTKLSGAGSPEIENPGALSTWVRELKEGEYTFRLAATDAHGNTSADTISITVTSPDYEEEIVVINPHHNDTEVHLFGNSSGIDQTHPEAPELLGGSGTFEGSPVDIRAILKFDLSNIPENAVIDSARLILYSNPTPLNGHDNVANSGPDNSLFIRRVTADWNYQTINWLNQPGSTDQDQISIPHTEADFEDLDVDVTTLVSAMLVEDNHGFLIRLQNETAFNFRIFCSSKYADASKHPKLIIGYHLEN